MTREFVMTEFFDLYWKKLNLTDDELKDFQSFLLEDPESKIYSFSCFFCLFQYQILQLTLLQM